MKRKFWVIVLFLILPLLFTGCSFSNDDSFSSKHNEKCEFGEWVILKNSTCTTRGRQEQKCLTDPRHLHVKETGMLGHKYETVITVAPTCTTSGEQADICQREGCGHKIRVIKLLRLNHSFGSWVTTETPCGQLKHRLCTNIGCTEKEVILPDKHDWGEYQIIKESNCTETGLMKTVCKNDATHEQLIVIPINIDEHSWGDWKVDISDPTKEVRTCLHNENHKQWRNKEI